MYQAYEKVKIKGTQETVGTGWLPGILDIRDYSERSKDIPKMAKELGAEPGASLPTKVDLRQWCSDIENQLQLGSCTANAAVGVVEYYENRARGKHIDGSRLFVYKTTRNLMGVVGDTGAWLRTAMGALALCGVPPEKYWPYTDNKEPGADNQRTFDDEPHSFVYALADNYEALRYWCHDPQAANVAPSDVLANVKRWIAAGVPSMFGFWGFSSFDDSDVLGGIPYPCPREEVQWGHAIVAVGYDDDLEITNTRCNKTTQGAFLIRNSWGTAWGDNGYGWMPYDYVLSRYALDFWSLLSMEWVDTKQFGL